MIDIPLNKALVAVEKKGCNCKGCFFNKNTHDDCPDILPCHIGRKDGKKVIFKLVDLPKEK